MLRRSTARLLAALLLPAAACALFGCSETMPSVTVQSMTVQKLALDSADYLVMCEIRNPNSWQMRIHDIQWTLSSDGRRLLAGSVAKPAELPPDKTVPLNMSLNLPGQVINEAGLTQKSRFPYLFEGTAVLDSPLGKLSVPFQNSGSMPIIHPLGVELQNVELIGRTETKVGMSMDLLITNVNDVALTPSVIKGDLLVNERPLVAMDTTLDNPATLTPRTSGTYHHVIWVRSPEVGVRTLAEMIADPANAYRLIGQIQFRLPGSGDVNDLLSESPPQ